MCACRALTKHISNEDGEERLQQSRGEVGQHRHGAGGWAGTAARRDQRTARARELLTGANTHTEDGRQAKSNAIEHHAMAGLHCRHVAGRLAGLPAVCRCSGRRAASVHRSSPIMHEGEDGMRASNRCLFQSAGERRSRRRAPGERDRQRATRLARSRLSVSSLWSVAVAADLCCAIAASHRWSQSAFS